MANRAEHALVFDGFSGRRSASEDPSEDLVQSPSLQTLREGAAYRFVELTLSAAFASQRSLPGVVVADGGHSDRYRLRGITAWSRLPAGAAWELLLSVRHSERAARALGAVRFSAVMDGGWVTRVGRVRWDGQPSLVEVRRTREGGVGRNAGHGDPGKRDDPRRTGGQT